MVLSDSALQRTIGNVKFLIKINFGRPVKSQ